jgi:hypothetical protein
VLLGVLVTAVVACSKPPIEEDREFETPDEPAINLSTETAEQTAAEPDSPTQTKPTFPPPPLPTAAPTTSLYASWQQAGNEATGLQLLAPPEWINLSGRLDATATANEAGLVVLLLGDSERTGESLLNDKALAEGAYVAGLLSHHNLPPNTPQATLSQYLTQLNKSITLLNEPAPITAFTASGSRLAGAVVDVVGEPLIFNSGQSDLHTRILLFTSTLAGAVNQDTQAVFLLSAPETTWAEAEPLLAQMAKTIVVHHIEGDFVIGGGVANVMGELGEMDMVAGELAEGVKDVWTFRSEGERYASLTLSPQTASLDLTMTLISPSGQTVAEVDNGFAGEMETAVDRFLPENGLYLIEVSEFFNQPGGYTLSLSLADQPLFSSGGQISLGQAVQSDLPADGQHVWRFTAEANTLVTIVLEPADFDVVLNVNAPDGRNLVELDEGFSGDAELVSGLALPVAGEYTILVHSFAGDGGSYTLSLESGGDETLNFYDAGDLAYGETRQETLQENEAHAWFFNGRAGDEILAEVTPLDNNLDLDVWLLDPNVERLAAVDELLAGQPEYLAHTLPQDGQYLLLVRDFFGEPGSYEIELTAAPANAPLVVGNVSYGDTVQGALAPGQRVVWHFDGRLNDTITIQLQPGNDQSDLRLILLDPAGNPVQEIDVAGTGQPEQLANFTLTADGQWGILVEEFFGETAGYSLVISEQ